MLELECHRCGYNTGQMYMEHGADRRMVREGVPCPKCSVA